jgi:NAD-dependent SIR2 family protein deacetylase
MVGWSKFDLAQPNVSRHNGNVLLANNPACIKLMPLSNPNIFRNSQKGHFALAELERMNFLGIDMKDKPEFYEPEEETDYYMSSSGQRQLAVVTQNVDSLHQRAGSKDIIQLHGGGSTIKCMQCGKKSDRNEYHSELEANNSEWLEDALQGYERSSDMRPDGDAEVKNDIDYNHLHLPNCPYCNTGFFKPDVVFFGDTVPKHRVALCQEAVEAADGILVVGTSLAVHSAFRHVRAGTAKGTPVAILNVGETRAETAGLEHILKIEAPAGDILEMCAKKFAEDLSLSQAGNL